MEQQQQQQVNTGLISLDAAARINGVDVDLRSVVREFGINTPEITVEELLRIAKRLEFKAKVKSLPLEVIEKKKYPLPAIIMFNDGSFGLLLKINPKEKTCLVLNPLEKGAKEIDFNEFYSTFKPDMIVLSHKSYSDNIKFGFKWFLKEILHYKKVILAVLTGSFVVQLFGIVTPLFTQVILDKVIVHRTITTLNVLAIGFIIITVFELLLNISRNYIFLHTANKIDAKLGSKMFRHLFSLPFMFFEVRKVGDIITRVRELDRIREFITNKSVSVIIDLFFSSVFLGMMYLYSPSLASMVLGFIGVIAVVYLFATPELRRRLDEKFNMGAHSNSYLVESVTGVQTVKSLAIEGSMFKKWENHLGNYIKANFDLAILGTYTGSFTGFVNKLMTISILYFGVKLVILNEMTVGMLIAFQMYAGQFAGPVLRLVNLWNEFQQTILAVDRISDILNHRAEIQDEKAITLPSIQGTIAAKNLHFKYNPNSEYVLNNVNFRIPPGTSVGIVGRSGSGKSTITKLIQKLYYPNEGSIMIDGVDIKHMNPLWLRNNIGIVLQENYLFSGTIRENIAMPAPNAPIEAIMQAAKIAGAHEFISELPKGYEEPVEERGTNFSGGQKQRIAIARALITNPKILIFDEATSALDYESEKIIQNNLNMIKKGRTMLIIAHRLSTIKDCDVIMAMDKGRIIEMGSHDQLMQKRGYYHYLFTQQGSQNTNIIQPQNNNTPNQAPPPENKVQQ